MISSYTTTDRGPTNKKIPSRSEFKPHPGVQTVLIDAQLVFATTAYGGAVGLVQPKLHGLIKCWSFPGRA